MRFVSLFLVCFAATAAYQLLAGAYHHDFYYEDSAAHFVTGVMVADYIRDGAPGDPVGYAEQYYLRSPKVAFGRWPPLFHVFEGCTFALCGASQAAALLLVAAIIALLTTCLYSKVAASCGAFVALLAVTLWVAFADVREHTLLVMSDMLTVLLCSLAVFSFGDYLTARHPRSLAYAAAWGFLGMLTKETALHLLLVAPLAIVVGVGGRWRDLWPRLAFAMVLILLGVGLIGIRFGTGLGVHGFESWGHLAGHLLDLDSFKARCLVLPRLAPPLLWALAICAPWAVARRDETARLCPKKGSGTLETGDNRLETERSKVPDPFFGQSQTAHKVAAVRLAWCWIAAISIFFVLSPSPANPRYAMTAFIPLLLLAAETLAGMRASLAHYGKALGRVGPAVVVAAAVAIESPLNWNGVTGYESVAKAVPVQNDTVTLISSNGPGEGAFIARRLMVDRRQQGIVLRGSKILAASDWDGTLFRLLISRVAEMRNYLLGVPVHYIVLDRHRFGVEETTPDRELLEQTLLDNPADFRLLGEFDLQRGGVIHDRAVAVYENVAAREVRPESIRVPLDHTLGRTLEWNPDWRPRDGR